MKFTKSGLKKIINEEIAKLLSEMQFPEPEDGLAEGAANKAFNHDEIMAVIVDEDRLSKLRQPLGLEFDELEKDVEKRGLYYLWNKTQQEKRNLQDDDYAIERMYYGRAQRLRFLKRCYELIEANRDQLKDLGKPDQEISRLLGNSDS